MRKLIYHGLLGAGALALLAVSVPVEGNDYSHDCDEACPPKSWPTEWDEDNYTLVPRLVGYGCKGSSGPLYANEEDHFPKCKVIEAWR